MKYLNLYKEHNTNPKYHDTQINDYVICCENKNTEIQDFIISNIGQIIGIDADGDYHVEYEKIPNKSGYFNYNRIRLMFRDEILFYSPNKEDCEMYLNANKYNL